MNRIILITWVWASWKTTLQEELLRRWWNRPVNFTTRKPRSADINDIDSDWDYISTERDEYIFLSRDNFITKYINWDFIEVTNPWDRLYWISKYMPEWNVVMVVDPVGRDQILEHFSHKWIEVETYFMSCSKDLQYERLIKRWDDDKSIAEKRRDFKWITPTAKCTIISGKKDPSVLADVIEKKWNEWKI